MAERKAGLKALKERFARTRHPKNITGQKSPSAAGSRQVFSSSRGRFILVLGLCFVIISALGLASVAGWAAANKLVVAEQDRPNTEVRVISLPDYSQDVSARMPDVRGLTADDARQALVDAGIPADFVTVTERAAAGTSGIIIQQTPVFGATNPNAVTLVVATEAKIPDSAGQPAQDVISSLRALGARVEQVRVFEPDSEEGTVVRTEPEAGNAVPDVVTVYTSDSPVTRSFDDFEEITGGGSSETDVLHLGVKYENGVSFSTGRGDEAEESAWDLKGKVVLLEGQYALDAKSEGSALVTVLGEGVSIAQMEVSSTAPTKFSWRVEGVNTLMIQVQRTNEDKSGRLWLLNPVFKGSFSDLGGETP